MEDLGAAEDQLKMQTFICEQVKLLEGSDEDVMRALAALVVSVAQLPEPQLPQKLSEQLPQIIGMLGHANGSIQKNAAAALTSVLGLSEDIWRMLITELGMVPQTVAALKTLSAADQDASVFANIINLMTASAQGGEEGARAVLAAGGIQPILDGCIAHNMNLIRETAADTLCQIATYEGFCREELSKLGVVDTLASWLAVDDAEIQCRALMGLGMLLPSSADNQRALADNTTAMQALLALMRQDSDMDIKIISKDLFVGLAKDHKEQVEAALRAALPS